MQTKSEIIDRIVDLVISENWYGQKAERERINLKKQLRKESKKYLEERLADLEIEQDEYLENKYK